MLLISLLEIQTVEIPLSGIIVSSLFLVILFIYIFVYFRFKIVKRLKISAHSENVELKNELSRIKEDIEIYKAQVNRKTTLISNISSEIKKPLNAIYGFAELLSDRNISSDERMEYVDMILRNTTNLLIVVNDIIDITKIEKGLLILNRESVHLNSFIDEMESYLKKELRIHHKSHIKVSTVTNLDNQYSGIYVDYQRMRKVLTNLINNAVKFTKDGFIEIGYKFIEEEFILFYVSDSGIGIEKEYQKSIFHEFTQINDIDLKVRTGSGLGLAVSKSIIELMGGKLWVESVKDSGSTFYFSLPWEASGEPNANYHNEHVNLGLNCWIDHTVLIVDDYSDIYLYFSESLVDTGITLLYADNGFKAIDLCKEHPEIELVLMDIQMPEMSGIDATKNIRKFRNKLPIIAQTAFAQSDDYDAFLDAGFNDLITKPFEKDVLLRKISKFLNM